MSAILRNSLRRIVQPVTPGVTSKATVISGPPRYHMPFAQKLGIGGGMCVAIILPMLYIIANIKHYKNPGGLPAEN